MSDVAGIPHELTDEDKATAEQLVTLLKTGRERQFRALLRSLSGDQRGRITKAFVHQLEDLGRKILPKSG